MDNKTASEEATNDILLHLAECQVSSIKRCFWCKQDFTEMDFEFCPKCGHELENYLYLHAKSKSRITEIVSEGIHRNSNSFLSEIADKIRVILKEKENTIDQLEGLDDVEPAQQDRVSEDIYRARGFIDCLQWILRELPYS